MPTIAYTAQPLPDMPANLTRNIADPGVRVGRDARVELKRNREWAKQLRTQHMETIKWYKRVKLIQR